MSFHKKETEKIELVARPEKVTKAVEAEVDELPGEFDHLEGEFVLLGVAKGPDVVDVTSNTHCMLTISFTITGRSSAGGSPASRVGGCRGRC